MYRIAARCEVSPKLLLEIETEVRRDYRGERCYIAAQRGDYRAYLENRNRLILRDARNGESTTLIARRYGISPVRVWQVLHAGQKQASD